MKNSNAKRILIYRLGSLGDTIVALPCFHLIARIFPQAERCLLTDLITNSKASHSSLILENTGLVHKYISYPVNLRDIRKIVNLRKTIRRFSPDILVNLQASRGRAKAYRDAFFFKWCGIKRIVGIPYTKNLQENRWFSQEERYEYEAARLARCLAPLGSAHLQKQESWELHLTESEELRAYEVLQDIEKSNLLIACSPDAKVDAKNWGIKNWSNLIAKINQHHMKFALVFIGAKDEYDNAEKIGMSWKGRKINLCGLLSPRESAAVLKRSSLFIGHDSGPMHLAATMRTPCVAIFSARDKPGVWFPYGDKHKILYHKTECVGCGLYVCNRNEKKCIMSITVNETYDAIKSLLQERLAPQENL